MATRKAKTMADLIAASAHDMPARRMAAMERNLAALSNDVDNEIALRVTEIRRIYAEIRSESAGRVLTLHELDKLGIADHLWTQITVLRNVVPLAQKKLKANTDAKLAAATPRGTTDSLRVKIMALMRHEKRAHVKFKTFLARWQRESINGLTLTFDGSQYCVFDDASEQSNTYKYGSLRTMFSKS